MTGALPRKAPNVTSLLTWQEALVGFLATGNDLKTANKIELNDLN